MDAVEKANYLTAQKYSKEAKGRWTLLQFIIKILMKSLVGEGTYAVVYKGQWLYVPELSV